MVIEPLPISTLTSVVAVSVFPALSVTLTVIVLLGLLFNANKSSGVISTW